MKRALIVSDGKPGHHNQSIALCLHCGFAHETVEVAYGNRSHKLFSYLLDWLGIYSERVFHLDDPSLNKSFDLVVSTGSGTYYANKVLAKKTGLPNIAILHPKGYRLDYSHIFCPSYDHPPQKVNITELPLNLCATDAQYFETKAKEFCERHLQQKPAAGVIVGGPNAVSTIDPVEMEQQLEQIFEATEGMERWVATSRRTPKQIEAVIEGFEFDYLLLNSRDAYNPIPAFIHLCDRLFVTSDSASMVSECASFGASTVEILKIRQLKTPNKFEELIQGLEKRNAAHIFDGTLGDADTKIDLGPLLRETLAKILPA